MASAWVERHAQEIVEIVAAARKQARLAGHSARVRENTKAGNAYWDAKRQSAQETPKESVNETATKPLDII